MRLSRLLLERSEYERKGGGRIKKKKEKKKKEEPAHRLTEPMNHQCDIRMKGEGRSDSHPLRNRDKFRLCRGRKWGREGGEEKEKGR